MKIADYISKSIQEFPSLFKDVDYEKSKLKVLDHIFFTNGNGLKMAYTENPKEGGYVTSPKYKKVDDNWTRVKDKPYGKEKYKAIPNGYFNSKGAKNTNPFSPYPFSKGYSIAWDVDFLQNDWKEALLVLCGRTLEYFNDIEQYKNNVYYPNECNIQQDVDYFKKRFESAGRIGLNELQKTWGYEIKDTLPNYLEVENRKTDVWVAFRKKQIVFLILKIDSLKQQL